MSKSGGKSGDIVDAYYQIVRHLNYTWDDLMNENLPQTLFTLEKLQEEAKENKEKLD